MKLAMDLHAALAPEIAAGVPGLVALVARGGKAEVVALGVREKGGAAVEPDSIFRVASMTKPVTAVATMRLVDDGVLQLDAPSERWLPELADRRVLRRIDAELDDVVPARRPITVRDVLSFTWGFGIPMVKPGTYPIQRAIDRLQLCNGMPMPSKYAPPDEWMRQLGMLPLMHQPGERWMYNSGSDVLGVLVARAAKKSFPEFLHERIFEPLGMRDTSFVAPAARFTAQYVGDTVYDPIDGEWTKPPPFPSGAAGLTSTVHDFHMLGAMLLAGGGKVLSSASVAQLHTDQLTPAQRDAANDFAGYFTDNTWGFGVGIVTGKDPSGSPGTFGWDGGTGSTWRCDPAEGAIRILLSNRAMTSPKPPSLFEAFWRAARA
ncbi:serine hydrolase [soil metagenome]